MGLKTVHGALVILQLLLSKSVRSIVTLHYCTFKDGGKCNSNIQANQTGRILKFEQPRGLNINLTCVSKRAIRWVLHIPLVSPMLSTLFQTVFVRPYTELIGTQESPIEGSEPVVQAEQGGNFSILTYSLNAYGPLYRFKGTIRCETYKNPDFFAQVFIFTGRHQIAVLFPTYTSIFMEFVEPIFIDR